MDNCYYGSASDKNLLSILAAAAQMRGWGEAITVIPLKGRPDSKSMKRKRKSKRVARRKQRKDK